MTGVLVSFQWSDTHADPSVGRRRLFSKYSRDQLTPVTLSGADLPTLVTEFNELEGGRYYDPRSKQSFKYDYIRDETSDVRPWTPDATVESWRSALEDLWTTYAREHYTNGVAAVFGSSSEGGLISLAACIEGHQFQPNNFWNGRWRSVWKTTLNPSTGKAEVTGCVRVQVHYYEDGNVQLVTEKHVSDCISVASEASTARDFVSCVESAENEYQQAIADNYVTMSDTTFKALRRPLPVTRAKFEWNRLTNYRLASELRQ